MKKKKKGPLSNTEKQYIEKNIDSTHGNVEQLCESLNRSASTVMKYVDKLPQPESVKKPTSNAASLMAKNEERGVTVMTEAASMAADESKKSRKNQAPGRYTQYIHKIKEG
tara:strand:+ start:2737 stop:3069 length:333 start_codon:yes stop_codon:yes gene_type:complete